MSRQTGSVTVKAGYIMAAGAIIAAVIGGIFLLIVSKPAIQTTVSGQDNPTVIQTGPGTVHITNTRGISADQFQRLAEELGVTKAALKSFFKILEQQAVPPEDLDSTLRTIAERYEALDQKLATFTSDDPTIQSLKEQARKALEEGNFERAEQLLNEASARDLQAAREMQSMANKRLLSAAASKAENGDLKYTQLAYAEAAAYYQQAAKLVPTDEQSILAEYLNLEGLLWLDAGQYAKARTPLERALGIREKTLGPEHLDAATSFNNLALLYDHQGRYEQAEPLYQRALGILEKALGPEHSDVATSLNNLAMLYAAQGRYAQAEPLYQRALVIDEKTLGSEHPDLATDLNNLAALYYAQGRYAQAEPLFQRALDILEKTLGPEHPDVAQSLNNLALLYYNQGWYEQAEPLLQRALRITEKALGLEHPNSVAIRKNYAALLEKMKQTDTTLSASE